MYWLLLASYCFSQLCRVTYWCLSSSVYGMTQKPACMFPTNIHLCTMMKHCSICRLLITGMHSSAQNITSFVSCVVQNSLRCTNQSNDLYVLQVNPHHEGFVYVLDHLVLWGQHAAVRELSEQIQMSFHAVGKPCPWEGTIVARLATIKTLDEVLCCGLDTHSGCVASYALLCGLHCSG